MDTNCNCNNRFRFVIRNNNLAYNGGLMKDNYWQKLVDKHLVGRKIVKVKWLSPEKSEEYFGWDAQPCEIHLDNGTILSPSQDDEGNDAGAIFTNLKEYF